jgi:uncharacterized protein (DUF1330 family)
VGACSSRPRLRLLPQALVIEFPTFERAVSCFESPEYQEASVFREAGGVVETVIVEGGEPTPQ